jgi:hypothetical protein
MKSFYENRHYYSVSDPDHTISISSDEVNNNGIKQHHVSAMEDGKVVPVEMAKKHIMDMNGNDRRELESMFQGFGKKKKRHSCKRRIYKQKSHKK